MNTNRILQLKAQKTFKKWDILLYVLLGAFILSLFWVFVFTEEDSGLNGIDVYYEDKAAGETLIFSYDFKTDEYVIDESWSSRVQVERSGEGLSATILTEDGGYNIVDILYSGEAFVLDANCSYRKDCVGFEHITRGDMVIICVPHHLKIIGVGDSDAQSTENPIVG